MLGLVVGKVLGITVATWLAVRTGLATLPEGLTWGAVVAVSALAGIGFTVSLFVAGLAFDSPSAVSEAKIGILLATVIAAVVGGSLLRRATRQTRA